MGGGKVQLQGAGRGITAVVYGVCKEDVPSISPTAIE